MIIIIKTKSYDLIHKFFDEYEFIQVNKKGQIQIYSVFKKRGKYKYEYFQVDKKGQIRIYSVYKKGANTNMNIFRLIKKAKHKYEYSDWYLRI